MAAKKKTAKKKAVKKVAKRPAAKKKTVKKAAKKSTKKVARKKASSGKKRTPNPSFMKPLTPSTQLAAVVGSSAQPRTQVISKLWSYIKKNDLQDSKNRRAINADDKLRPLFGGKSQVTMFDLAKIANKHLS